MGRGRQACGQYAYVHACIWPGFIVAMASAGSPARPWEAAEGGEATALLWILTLITSTFALVQKLSTLLLVALAAVLSLGRLPLPLLLGRLAMLLALASRACLPCMV